MDDNTLSVKWSKKEDDLIIHYPRKCDGALMNHILGEMLIWGGINGQDKGWLNYKNFNLRDELEKRGYDIKTLNIKIKLKETKQ